MKSKNITLGLVTLLFAVGSAFASVSMSHSNATLAYYMEIEGDQSTCTLFQTVDCIPGAENCKRNIPLLGETRQLWEVGCESPLDEEAGF